ncbi:MAG: GGDEF domain-containing protein [Bilophila wadsworthia]
MHHHPDPAAGFGTVSRYDKFMTLLATTDKLTGLMNRERFNAILSQKLWERPLVFMFDVDHFKHINDTRGHLWGNEVLARVGHKAEEIVGKAGCVARWGGDEFIGFIDAPGDAEETLRCLLESVRDLDNHVTISIGATRINPEDDMDAIPCAWTTACTAPKPKAGTASPTFEAQADWEPRSHRLHGRKPYAEQEKQIRTAREKPRRTPS